MPRSLEILVLQHVKVVRIFINGHHHIGGSNSTLAANASKYLIHLHFLGATGMDQRPLVGMSLRLEPPDNGSGPKGSRLSGKARRATCEEISAWVT